MAQWVFRLGLALALSQMGLPRIGGVHLALKHYRHVLPANLTRPRKPKLPELPELTDVVSLYRLRGLRSEV